MNMPERQFSQTFDSLTPSGPAAYVIAATVIIALFAGDLLIPQANLAIGYSMVPILAVQSRQRWFLFLAVITCTLLTWIGLFADSLGAQHMTRVAVLDRALVTGVLWLVLVLIERREQARLAVNEQYELLNAAARELARSNRELEEFAAVVAHDLRGPLLSIRLMAALLKSTHAGDGDARVASIESQVAVMGEFIRRLLDYGRAGGASLRTESCDCEAILVRARQNLQADLQASGGEVVGEHLPTIVADPKLITQLFQNLIENAIKYRSQLPPLIRISAAKRDDYWVFSVADNGKGIEPTEAHTIFQPYRQSGSDVGIGLGLATCKRIVELHGGKIWAEPLADGGAVFQLHVALICPAIVVPAEPKLETDAGRVRK